MDTYVLASHLVTEPTKVSKLLLSFLTVAIWAGWGLQFAILVPTNRGVPVTKDLKARRGMALEALAYCVLFIHPPQFWSSPAAAWRLTAGIASAIVAFCLSWNAIRHLAHQWRVDAALNNDHNLVVTGPYGYVRHPIYASMLCMFLMNAAFLGTWPGWIIGSALFIFGTEIRVRAEDRLLHERFGDMFYKWRQRVPAYIPFLR